MGDWVKCGNCGWEIYPEENYCTMCGGDRLLVAAKVVRPWAAWLRRQASDWLVPLPFLVASWFIPSFWGIIPLAVCVCWWGRVWGWAQVGWSLFAGAVFLLMFRWGGLEREGVFPDMYERVLVSVFLAGWLTGCAWLAWFVGRVAIRWIERKYHEDTEAGR